MVKTIVGNVVSDKMTNTVVVEIERKLQHPVYKKYIKINKNIQADTNGLTVKVGQRVVLQETKPISRAKHFKVIEIVKEEARSKDSGQVK
jgi:small subunit ribosomal protein S17